VDKVIFVRSILRYIALAVLALVGPLDGVQATMAPSAQACQCGCALSPDEPCRCHAPARPQTAGKVDPPCHSAPSTWNSSSSVVRKTTTDLLVDSESSPAKKTDPRPWPLSTTRTVQTPPSVAATLRRWTGQQNPPPNLGRLAQLECFLV